MSLKRESVIMEVWECDYCGYTERHEAGSYEWPTPSNPENFDVWTFSGERLYCCTKHRNRGER